MKRALSLFLPILMFQALALDMVAQAGDPNIPPSVNMLSPPDGAFIPGPADILLAAGATDPDGTVVTVEFFVNGESVGYGNGIVNPWFSFFYLLQEDMAPGDYEIVALATDNHGAETESDPVAITIFEEPVVPVVGVVATDPEASEPGVLTSVLDTATFTFRRSGPTDDPLDVFFSLHGEAIVGEDYVEVPTVITIPAGRSWADLIIQPIDDDLVEGDERVVVRIEPVDCEDAANCYEVSRYARARAVIHDNDTPPNLPPRAKLIHPHDGQLFRAPADILLVAKAFDLDGDVVQVEFFEGDNSLGVVPAPEIEAVPGAALDIDDPSVGPFYRLTWEDVPAGGYVLTAVATDDDGDEGRSRPVEIKVVEIQPPPVVTIVATDPEASEPGVLTVIDYATFTVSRTGPLHRPLTVLYRVGGSAENGVDYDEIPHRIHFPIGAATADIEIRPIDDNIHEGDETVKIGLVPCRAIADVPMPSDACYRVGIPGRARAVIHDNDPPPPNHPPHVRLIRPLDGSIFRAPADIRLAAAAEDRDGTVESVAFYANDDLIVILTRDGIILPASNTETPDGALPPDIADPIELWHYLWQGVGPGAYELVAVATDDDGDSTRSDPVAIRVLHVPVLPVVNIFAVDPIAVEGSSGTGTEPDTATFKVVRTGPTGHALVVRYVTAGTAIEGEDYVELSGSVIIPEGASSAPVVIVPIDDDVPEFIETVEVRVVEGPCVTDADLASVAWSCYRVGNHPVDRAYIIDDDPFPNIPPRVEILRPVDGAHIPGPADIRVVADARDIDGFVRSVEFFANGESIGIVFPPPPGSLTPISVVDHTGAIVHLEANHVAPDLQYPWQILWRHVQPGLYALTAVATDNDGDSTESAPVNIVVFPDPEPPVVEVKATDPVATEPDVLGTHLDTATFTICRDGPVNRPLTVYYHLGGDAENGIDYRQLPTAVTIPTGERCIDVVVRPLDDNLVEGPESVVLALREVPCVVPADLDGTTGGIDPMPLDCYFVGRCGKARAVIYDNDQPNHPPYVRMVHPRDGDLFLGPTDIRLAAWAFDLDGDVVQVEFFEGDNSLGVVTVPTPQPNTDALHPDILPLYQLLWEDVPAGRYTLTARATDDDGDTGISDPVRIRVIEIQPPPVVTIEATDDEAAEPDPGGTELDIAVFSVNRHGPLGRPLTVHYRIDGSATNGEDYEEIPRSVTIPVDAASAEIRILPIDDDVFEGTERVRLTLVPSVCIATFPPPADCHYIIGTPSSASAAILDNDPPPPNEPPIVNLIRPHDGSIFAAPATILLAANAGDPDGQVVQVEFFANGDSLGVVPQGDPTDLGGLFRLWWEDVGPGFYVLTAVATDDDGDSTTSEPVNIAVIEFPGPAVVNVFATDPIAREQNPYSGEPLDPAMFTVVRDGSTAESLTVHYDVSGTADNGVDYHLLSGEVTIPQGQLAEEIYVVAIDDLIHEPTESVIVEIVELPCIAIYPPPPECYVRGDHPVAAAEILDNDPPPNLPPVAQITAPPQGSVYTEPATVDITVAAVDPDGWVQKMEIFANGRKIDEQEIYFIVPPPPGQEQFFDFMWENVPAGFYRLTARATDQLGSASWTGPVVIWVRESPAIPVVNVFAIDRLAREEPGPNGQINTATFKVRRDGGDLGQPLEVHYELGGSADNGVDYEELSGVVTIPAGRHGAREVVVPIDDELPEGRESVKIRLFVATDEDPPPYIVGHHGRAGAVIVDRDFPTPVCRPLKDGLMYVCKVAESGQAFQVEVSTDMIEWTPLETVTVVEDALHYVDAMTDGAAHKSYRFVPIPHDPMALED